MSPSAPSQTEEAPRRSRLRALTVPAERWFGAELSRQICAHHARRLRRIGWERALDPEAGGWRRLLTRRAPATLSKCSSTAPSAAGRRGGDETRPLARRCRGLVLHALLRPRAHGRLRCLTTPAGRTRGMDPCARARVGRRTVAALPPFLCRCPQDARPPDRRITCTGGTRLIRATPPSSRRQDHRHRRPDRIRRRNRPHVRGRRSLRHPQPPRTSKGGLARRGHKDPRPCGHRRRKHFGMRWHETTWSGLPDRPQPRAGNVEPQIVRMVPEKIDKRHPPATSESASHTFVSSAPPRRFIYPENQFLWSP